MSLFSFYWLVIWGTLGILANIYRMSLFSFYWLVIWGTLGILANIYRASQHGKPRGPVNAVYAVLDTLFFVTLLLIAFEKI